MKPLPRRVVSYLFGGLGRAAATVSAVAVLVSSAAAVNAYVAKQADLTALAEDVSTYRLKQERRQLRLDQLKLEQDEATRPLIPSERQRKKEIEDQLKDVDRELDNLKRK